MRHSFLCLSKGWLIWARNCPTKSNFISPRACLDNRAAKWPAANLTISSTNFVGDYFTPRCSCPMTSEARLSTPRAFSKRSSRSRSTLLHDLKSFYENSFRPTIFLVLLSALSLSLSLFLSHAPRVVGRLTRFAVYNTIIAGCHVETRNVSLFLSAATRFCFSRGIPVIATLVI